MEGPTIKTPRTKRDLERLAEFSAAIFPGNDYYEAYDYMRKRIPTDPEFRPEHWRFIEHDGEVLSASLLLRRELKAGDAWLQLGGLGAVGTHPKARGHGYAAAIIRAHLAYMREAGYDLAALFGIPKFYLQFGFTTSLFEFSTVVKTSDALAAAASGQDAQGGQGARAGSGRPGIRIRRFRRGDLAGIEAIYAAGDEKRHCSIRRSPAYWSWRFPRFKKATVAEAPGGRVVGYAVLGEPAEDTVRVLEFGVLPEPGVAEAAAAALVRAVGLEAQKAVKSRVTFFLSPDHPVARFLFRRCEGENRAAAPLDRDGMLWLVNVESTLKKMEAELSRRLAGSRFHDWSGVVALRVASDGDGVEPVNLSVESGRVTVGREGQGRTRLRNVANASLTIAASQQVLTRLLLGYEDFGDSPAVTGLSDDQADLGRTLFPRRDPFIPRLDRF